MQAHLEALITYFSAHPHIALGAVFAAALLEAVAVIGTVIPGSSIVFIGGVLIGLGALDPWLTSAVAIAGAILGDGISYWLGHRYHEHIRTVWPMKNYPGLFARGQAYFARNGGKSVFVGRFLGPLRAIVPVVAGMANMPPGHFYAMNILSALAWSAAHLVPGVLFGATLQVAGAVSSRLVVLLIVIVILLWAIGKLVRFGISSAWPRIAALRDRAVDYARARPGRPARILLSLFDPARAESPALFTAAVLLIGSAWMFLGILEDVASNDPLVQLDQTINGVLQGMRTEWADSVMITVTDLGGAAGSVPVIIAVSLLLALKRYWRTLGYWLAAVGFAQIFVWMLKYVLGRARPHNIYTGFEQFSFPSGHAASSIVVYGFIAFLLGRRKPVAARLVVALVAALVIGLVAFSRLYLGVHWFSDVAASLSFGLAWVALLGIAYTHHVQNETVRAWPLGLAVLTTLALVAGPYVNRHHAADVERYSYRPSAETISLTYWRADGWRSLPRARADFAGEIEEPFSVQWSGAATQIVSVLAAVGWEAPPPWSARTTLLWLLPAPSIADLPVLPKLHRGEPQQLTLVKHVGPSARVVLRLWPLRELIDTGTPSQPRPLWVGSVATERLRHPLGMVTLAETTADFVTPVRILEQDVVSERAAIQRRSRNGLPVLLVW